MADNVTLNAGSGGDTIAADDVSGVKYQVVKVAVGADGSASLVSNSNPVPVSDAGSTISIDDGAGSITVDGTVAISGTVAVTDNASTLSIDDGGGSITVDGTVAATQSGTWNVGTVTTVTTVSAVTAISNALPAGTNNIGDVDVLSVVPGTSATSLGKAEDAAHTTGDTGVMVLAVRNDAGTALAGTTGDYIPLSTDANGALRVVGSSGTTQYTEDGASAGGESLCLAGFVRQDTLASSTSADGDYAYGKVNANGAQYVAIESGGITGRAEDSAHTTGHEGVVILAVRRDSASSGVDTDGDYATLSVTSDGSLRVSGSAGTTQYAEDAASAGAESLCLAGAVRQDTLASNTSADGDYTYLKTTSAGRLYTDAVVSSALPAGTNNIGDVDVLTLPNVTLAAGTNTNEVVGDVAQDAAVAGNPVLIGARASTATPTAMSADGDAVYPWATREGALVTAGAIVDDAAFTPGTSRVHVVGFTADETSTDSVDEGDAGAARMTLDRKQIVSSYAHAAGGATPGRLVSAASTNGTVVKASAGTLYALVCMNLNAAVRYLKVYNSTSVTVGTTTPTWTFPIPASTTGAGFNVPIPSCGIAFGTGICLGITTGIADNDTGAVAANEIVVNYAYI